MNWKKLNRKRLPKTGLIVGGSWRVHCFTGARGWSVSGVFPVRDASLIDDDRTHYIRLANPPTPKPEKPTS